MKSYEILMAILGNKKLDEKVLGIESAKIFLQNKNIDQYELILTSRFKSDWKKINNNDKYLNDIFKNEIINKIKESYYENTPGNLIRLKTDDKTISNWIELHKGIKQKIKKFSFYKYRPNNFNGYRLIYTLLEKYKEVLFIHFYSKNEKEDLSYNDEKNLLIEVNKYVWNK